MKIFWKEVILDQSNITQVIIDTINSIFDNLLQSIDFNIYAILDSLTFVNGSIMQSDNFKSIFGTSISNGILLISNSLLLATILYFSIKYLISHYTYSQIERPYSFLIKLVICGICMNCSYYLMNFILDLFSYFSSAICELGSMLFGKTISFSELIAIINSNISVESDTFSIFSLDGLIKSILSFSLLNLVFSYSFRYIMIQVFVFLAPFAIISASLNSTSWFFVAWFKNLFSLLFIQVIVAIILVILFAMDYSSSDLITKIIYIGGIYALIKANSFVREFIGGISTTISQSVDYFSFFKK